MTLPSHGTQPAAAQLATAQIHAGYEPEAPHRAVAVPLYQSAAYEFPDYASARRMFALKEPGFTYSRTGNPTVAVLERRVAALEGGVGALATATGQSAVAVALLALVRGGQHLVASSKMYGGTVDLLTDTFADFGIQVTFADPDDVGAWAAAVRPGTRAFLTESIGNPLGHLQDLPALAGLAHGVGVPLVVDNTLATPVLCRPLERGADVVVHSATKFLGGHGSSLAGVIVDGGRFDFSAYPDKWPQLTRPKQRYGADTLWQRHGKGAYLALARSKYLHDLGPSLSPFNAAQILQGLETLDIRVARHAANTLDVAGFLAAHPAVAVVHHTSVPGHPQARLAARDFPAGTGSILSFDLAETVDVGAFIDRLNLFKLVANVGDTRSLVAHPAAMTHCRLSPQQRAEAGIKDGTIRLSIGLEAAGDLIGDLAQALEPGFPAGAAPPASSAVPTPASSQARSR